MTVAAEPPATPASDRHVFEALTLLDLEDRLFPRPRTLLDRTADRLALLGAVSLGLATACLCMLVLYVILNLLLNFQP